MVAETWTRSASRCDFYLQKNTTRFSSPITRTMQTLDRAGRRYVARYTFRVVGQEDAQAITAMLTRGDSFLMWDQRREKPLNGILTGVALSAAHLRGNVSIAVDGLPISVTKLKAGDYVGIGGKLYDLANDVTADGAGAGTLTLTRGLLADAADNTPVVTDKPTCEMLLESDDAASAPMEAGELYVFDLSFIESL